MPSGDRYRHLSCISKNTRDGKTVFVESRNNQILKTILIKRKRIREKQRQKDEKKKTKKKAVVQQIKGLRRKNRWKYSRQELEWTQSQLDLIYDIKILDQLEKRR